MGCVEFTAAAATPAGWLEMEAEAYCGDLREMMTTEQGVREGADLLVERLMTGRRYRGVQALGQKRVREAVYRACEIEVTARAK